MLPEYRYFKCNMLGGFRLSDLNLSVKQEQYFHIDSHVAQTSRAVQSALKAKWMIEVNAEEASQHIEDINIKKTKDVSEEKPNVNSISKVGVAVPNVKETNKKLESRQAARQENEKTATPNFIEVEKTLKARNEEALRSNKTDKKLFDEVVPSPAKADDDTEFETIDPTVKTATAEADEEGVTTIKSLSKDDDEDAKNTVEDDLNSRIRRRRTVKENE